MDPQYSLQDCDLCEIPVTLSTMTFVTYIYVKPVWENTSLINLKNTTSCHLS